MTTELLNEKEVYNVNDTITLISDLPKLLTDNSTPYPKDIDYGNSVGIGGPLRAFILDSINHTLIYAIDSFALTSIIGSVVDDTGASSSTRSLFFMKMLLIIN